MRTGVLGVGGHGVRWSEGTGVGNCMGPMWGDSEGPEIAVQSPARGCGGRGLVSVPL